MDDHEEAPSGRVYSLADGPRAVPTDSACCLTNGPAVRPDGRSLYPVDTLETKIWRHEIGTDGELTRSEQIGNASCRERLWQYVSHTVCAGSLNKTTQNVTNLILHTIT